MKTKFLCFILASLLIFTFASPAFASTDYVNADYDFDNQLFVISGDIGDGVHMVTVYVYRSSNGAPVYVDQVDSESDGTYSASVPFDVLTKETYDIIVSSDNLVTYHTASKFFNPELVPSEDVTTPDSSTENTRPSKPSNQTGGGGGGSGVSIGSSLITPPANPTPAPIGGSAVQTGSTFADVTPDHWSFEGVEALAAKGIINGVGDGMFAPDSSVTREQFAKMLIEAFDLDIVVGDTGFTDVDINSWSYPYLISAYKYGVMNGYSATEMGGSHEISRQDMAVMVWRMLDIVEKPLPQKAGSAFADGDSIADYAKGAVAALQSNSIISGMGDNMYMPNLTVNRAMAAVVIHRTLNAIK